MGLMVVHTIAFYIKTSKKVKEQNPQESDKKNKEEPVENLNKSTILNDAWLRNKMNYVSLGTIPFILRKRSLKIAVNALLDDGSTKIILTVMVQQNYIFKVKQKLCSFNWSHIDSIAKRAMQVFTANFVTVNLRLS